jgi:hypothetical protein
MNDIERLVAALSDEVQAVEPAPHPHKLGLQWISAAALYLLAALALTGLRPDWRASLGDPWFAAEIAALCALLVVSAFSAAVLAFPDLHQRRRTAFAPAWAFALFALLMFLSWRADVPPAPLPAHNFECTLSILLFSLLPAAAIFYAMRRFASTHPRLFGMVAVLYAFSAGALWLRLHEQTDSIAHVVEWHYLPIIAVAALGGWLGKALLRW